MNKFNIPLVAQGLTTYAIEWQNSLERHQPEDAPPWVEQRRLWTDAILQGMARLEGLTPDPRLMEQFDLELEQACGCYFTVPATQQMQKDTIQELRRFVAALEATGDDRRRQINVVRELLEDMTLHPHWWNGKNNGLDRACNEVERSLVRVTAQMPIPLHPYPVGRRCRALSSALGTVDASDFDLEIINWAGDRFLDERGGRWVGGPYQMNISAEPVQSQDGPVPFQMGPTM